MKALVIFDLWNTLVYASGPRFVDRLAMVISNMSGTVVPVDKVIDYVRSTGCLHEEIEVEELAHEFWRYELGTAPPMSLAGQVNREHIDFVSNAILADNSIQALNILKNQGLHTAVVSNATSASLEVVTRLGIRELVDEVWISCQSGYLKPDPRAFITAANHFDVLPSCTVVVGDKMTTDILGARLAGMNAVLLDPKAPNVFLHPNSSMLAVIPNLKSIETIVPTFDSLRMPETNLTQIKA